MREPLSGGVRGAHPRARLPRRLDLPALDRCHLLGDQFQLIGVEVGLVQLIGVEGGKDLDLDDEVIVVDRVSAEIAGVMTHGVLPSGEAAEA